MALRVEHTLQYATYILPAKDDRWSTNDSSLSAYNVQDQLEAHIQYVQR